MTSVDQRISQAGTPSKVTTAIVLLRLTWARTVSFPLVIGVSFLALLPVVFAVAFVTRETDAVESLAYLVQRFDQVVYSLATPIIALLLGTSAFNAESEDGTLVYLITTATPRWWIGFVRIVFAATCTSLISVLAVLVSGHLVTGGDDPEGVVRAFALASVFGGTVYSSLFTMLSLITRRALAAGLVYVLFWEGVLSGTFPGVSFLSVRQWTLSVTSSLTTWSHERLVVDPSVVFSVSAGALTVVLAVMVLAKRLAEPRLGRI